MKHSAALDGLRGLAVLGVLIFHLNPAMLRGGYLGVDVFFVLSGYLTQKMLDQTLHEKNWVLNFAKRRISRLLPALFTVLAVSTIFSWFWLDPRQYDVFARTLAFAASQTSNIYLWMSQDYFNPLGKENPLLHTWSLGVEVQFYCIYVVLIVVTQKYARLNFKYFLLSATLASFLASIYLAIKAPTLSFYLIPTRFWELALGAICALNIRWIRRLERPEFAKHALHLGILIILTAYAIFDEQSPTPFINSFLAVSGTVLILTYIEAGGKSHAVLSWRPLTSIGLLSYSLYLWHQPIITLAKIRLGGELSIFILFLLVALTYLLSYLTTKLIEKKFRITNKESDQKKLNYQNYIPIFFVVLIAISFIDNKIYYDRNLSDRAKYLQTFRDYENRDYYDEFMGNNCFLSDKNNDFSLFQKDNCLKISKTKTNILILGDSHAAHLNFALREKFPAINFLQATASGCRPFIDPTGEGRCTKLINYIYKDFLQKNRVDGVIFSARWSSGDRELLTKTLEYLVKINKNVILVGPTPVYKTYAPILLRDSANSAPENISRIAYNALDETRFSANKTVYSVARKFNLTYVNLLDTLCNSSSCLILDNSQDPVVFDRAHYTKSGSRIVVDKLLFNGMLREEMFHRK